MITIINDMPEPILGIIMTGEITKEDYDRLNPILEDFERKHDTFKFYAEMHDFKWSSAKAMWEDLKTDIKHLGNIHTAAIVTDKKWIENITDTASIIPNLTAKGFDMDEREQAMEWIKSA